MCRGGLAYFRKLGFIKIDHNDTYLDEVVGAVIALLGFGTPLFLRSPYHPVVHVPFPPISLSPPYICHWSRCAATRVFRPAVWCSRPCRLSCLHAGFQLRAGWGLPFPLNLLFLPLRLWEGFLAYYVAK